MLRITSIDGLHQIIIIFNVAKITSIQNKQILCSDSLNSSPYFIAFRNLIQRFAYLTIIFSRGTHPIPLPCFVVHIKAVLPPRISTAVIRLIKNDLLFGNNLLNLCNKSRLCSRVALRLIRRIPVAYISCNSTERSDIIPLAAKVE